MHDQFQRRRIEAAFFGKRTHYVYSPATEVRYRGDAADGGHWSVHSEFLAPDLWRDLLAPVVAATGKDGDVAPAKPNRLRIALQSFWGYDQIDADTLIENSCFFARYLEFEKHLPLVRALDRAIRNPVIRESARVWRRLTRAR